MICWPVSPRPAAQEQRSEFDGADCFAAGAEAIVEFGYSGPGEPIILRFDRLRVVGTFDMVGPDQGRFEPFWRLNALRQDVLTVRAEAPTSASPRCQSLSTWSYFVIFSRS
jgi:hypothetical protein